MPRPSTTFLTVRTGVTYVKPLICLFLGLGALVVVSLIGHQQIQRAASLATRRSNQKLTSSSSENGQDMSRRTSADRWPPQYATELEKVSSQLLLKNIRGDNIRKNLRQLSKRPHPAGTPNNRRVAEWIRDQWRTQGLDDVHFAEYDVLLSHPSDPDRPNTVELLSEDRGRLIFRSIGIQPPLIPDEQSDPGANLTYNAYSASGTVVGRLVYANYGRRQDFEYLERQNITLKGRIVIMRYGYIWRGAKAIGAQRRGAIGVILYSDPAEVCAPNSSSTICGGDRRTFPYTAYMPKGGVQLGSLMGTDGDPLTPLYPATDYAYRSKSIEDLTNEEILPKIPVQPISYSDAYQFLSRMKGRQAPTDWQGGLNVTYRLDQGGDGQQQQPTVANGINVRLTVRANTTRGKIRNVIGFIEGRSEPDRYVIVGNHFDAWIYGAVDPNSGTAVMLEMSRAFMRLINETAWRPLRTIVFCAWDAEEYGLIGSTEWIEQYTTLLTHRAVAYLNVDLIAGNQTLLASATPTLYQTAVTSARRVPNPDPLEYAAGRRTIYDTWIRQQPSDVIAGVPRMGAPNGGSDHVSFFKYLGVPVIDFSYDNLTKDQSYPLYHTLYETPYLNEKILDPNNFAFHTAIGQFWAEMTRQLADTNLLPLNVDDFAVALKKYAASLNATLFELGLMESKDVQMDYSNFENAIEKLYERSLKFHFYADEIRRSINHNQNNNIPIDSNYFYYYQSLEMFNSRLTQVERCFVNPRGDTLTNRPDSRHVIYGTGSEDSYAANRLPHVYDQLGRYAKAESEEERLRARNGVRQQLSIVTYSIHCATSLLKKTPVKAI